MKKKIALRMDDPGAATKVNEIYSRKWRGLGNILFFKRLPYFKQWAVYREMTAHEWETVLTMLQKYNAKLTVGVTAAWVNWDGTLTPFPDKFPENLKVLKDGVADNLLEIANHGLTHCVLKDNLFRPRWFTSNQSYHREFWDWLDKDVHFNHIRRSQEILQDAFGVKITTLVPPGNVFSKDTVDAAAEFGITAINCKTDKVTHNQVKIIPNTDIFDFHDKEVVEFGPNWLEKKIQDYSEYEFCFVRDL